MICEEQSALKQNLMKTCENLQEVSRRSCADIENLTSKLYQLQENRVQQYQQDLKHREVLQTQINDLHIKNFNSELELINIAHYEFVRCLQLENVRLSEEVTRLESEVSSHQEKAEELYKENISYRDQLKHCQDKKNDYEAQHEINSLHAVLDIKKSKIADLENELAIKSKKADLLCVAEERILKLQNRCEDLEMRLEMQKQQEAQLVRENINLNESFIKESTKLKSISKEKEELQWKLDLAKEAFQKSKIDPADLDQSYNYCFNSSRIEVDSGNHSYHFSEDSFSEFSEHLKTGSNYSKTESLRAFSRTESKRSFRRTESKKITSNQSFSQAESNQSLSKATPKRSFSKAGLNQSFSKIPLNHSFSKTPSNQSFSKTSLNQSFSKSTSKQSFSKTALNQSFARTVSNQSISKNRSTSTISKTGSIRNSFRNEAKQAFSRIKSKIDTNQAFARSEANRSFSKIDSTPKKGRSKKTCTPKLDKKLELTPSGFIEKRDSVSYILSETKQSAPSSWISRKWNSFRRAPSKNLAKQFGSGNHKK